MRRSQAAVLVTVLAVLLSGCSTNQVKAWFAVFAGQDLTPTEAERIASQVNAEMVPGCDENYSGVCVPNNTTDVDCWGLGDGPNWVVGPILCPVGTTTTSIPTATRSPAQCLLLRRHRPPLRQQQRPRQPPRHRRRP